MVAECVTPGYRVADIGTDHGYVPIYLIKNHLASHVIAMDINEGPLEKAMENIRLFQMEDRIETRLSDGFDRLEAGETDIAVIAGMGGALIRDILAKGRDVVAGLREMVLSPHSEIHLVREYLWKEGHKIVEEKMLVEDGKYYTILKTCQGHEKKFTEQELKYGRFLLERKDPVLWDYLEKKQRKLELIMRQIESLEGSMEEKTRERYEIIRKESNEIRELLSYYDGGFAYGRNVSD